MRYSFVRAMACVVLFLASCSTGKMAKDANYPNGNISVNGKMYSAAFIQNAAEYRALCYQAFNMARYRLDEFLMVDKNAIPPAIVTDIDETILDNSPYEVNNTLQGKSYSTTTWYEWTGLRQADTVPGALSFLKYAKSRGVEIFYITNRDEVERNGTLGNLNKFGFPDADNAHLLLREKSSSKESRRSQVLKTHRIILLLGDNLADFSGLYDKKSTAERKQQTDALRDEFGSRFIILPNPTYGDWESALYQYNYKLTTQQKDSAIRASLRGF